MTHKCCLEIKKLKGFLLSLSSGISAENIGVIGDWGTGQTDGGNAIQHCWMQLSCMNVWWWSDFCWHHSMRSVMRYAGHCKRNSKAEVWVLDLCQSEPWLKQWKNAWRNPKSVCVEGYSPPWLKTYNCVINPTSYASCICIGQFWQCAWSPSTSCCFG